MKKIISLSLMLIIMFSCISLVFAAEPLSDIAENEVEVEAGVETEARVETEAEARAEIESRRYVIDTVFETVTLEEEGPQCVVCGVGSLYGPTTSYTAWGDNMFIGLCGTDHGGGMGYTHVERIRQKTSTWSCNNCNYKEVTTSWEYSNYCYYVKEYCK